MGICQSTSDPAATGDRLGGTEASEADTIRLKLGEKVNFKTKSSITAGELCTQMAPSLGIPADKAASLWVEFQDRKIEPETTLIQAGIQEGDRIEVRGVSRTRKILSQEADEKAQKAAPEFMEACKRGDVKRVMRFLEDHPALAKAQDSKNASRTGLHRAASLGLQPLAKALLDKSADPNAQDSKGATPVHMAASCNQPEVLRELLQAGGDAGAIDGQGRTPLDCATKSKNSTANSRKTIALCTDKVPAGSPRSRGISVDPGASDLSQSQLESPFSQPI
eukprot:TRINITY_DN28840_c0_g1_i1.p1 TRINITY_DN28840_c0_g1~~TRINITY_DN28840_c0_g1_i1.p1  ORF type:complete len:279 (-),score=81.49 TRINITY_DN28840_c0_g1_i1:313-1149(-)